MIESYLATRDNTQDVNRYFTYSFARKIRAVQYFDSVSRYETRWPTFTHIYRESGICRCTHARYMSLRHLVCAFMFAVTYARSAKPSK